MTWLSLGSMALPFHLRTQGVQMRIDIARLGAELTTGLVQDPSRHLGGATGPLAALTAGLARNEAYLQSVKTSAIRADLAQAALTTVSDTRGRLAQELLLAKSGAVADGTLASLGAAAQAALADTVAALSARSSGAALFSGTNPDRVPLASADEMLADLAPLVSGLTSAAQIADTISAAFLDPGGLFDTDFYRGGPEATGPVIGDGQTLAALPTADTLATRQLLAGLATAAILAAPPPGLAPEGRRDLVDRATNLVIGAAAGIAELQSRTGTVQAALETRQTRLLAERDTLSAGKLALVAADPYETATRLQDTQARLDALYTITARTARLSLTEYL